MMKTYESLDDVLAHYGVKGMKWGVRRSQAELDRAAGRKPSRRQARLVRKEKKRKQSTPSEDAVKAAQALDKAKKRGIQSLSNEELAQLNARLNLEQQYSRLSTSPGKVQKGHDFAKATLSVGKTANEMVAFANSPVGRQISAQLTKKPK